jgi:hypothetical protein
MPSVVRVSVLEINVINVTGYEYEYTHDLDLKKHVWVVFKTVICVRMLVVGKYDTEEEALDVIKLMKGVDYGGR